MPAPEKQRTSRSGLSLLKKSARGANVILRRTANVWLEAKARRRLAGQLPTAGSVECALYFADERINAYQVRQWYEPMRRLSESHPVALLVRTPRAALDLIVDCPLPIVLATSMPEQERFLGSHPIQIFFYVNNNKENFLPLRFTEPVHIHLSHGESDKTSMASNQLKAYDYAFVAGAASRDRIQRQLRNFDVGHLLEIGRPQLDVPRNPRPMPDDGRTVVLYAPTWEGDRAAMAYGSIVSHGETIVAELLADPRFRLVYRPHPRVGVQDKRQAVASATIKSAIARANEADPDAHHVVDDAREFGWPMDAADVGIVDISAMAADWLSTRKPMIVTKPSEPSAKVDPDGLAGALWLMPESEAPEVRQIIERLMRAGTPQEQLAQVEYHFGDTAPGACMSRFLRAVEEVLD